MKKKPIMLDLYCGAGGAAMGYHQAGFTIVGVDIKPQPRYPFFFKQADAVEYLQRYFQNYDAIHASPPCQAHTILRHLHKNNLHRNHIAKLRILLYRTRKPFVIENVPGAPLSKPVLLCGTMFGLRVYRHRLFESNVTLPVPPHPPHIHRTHSGHKDRQRKSYFLNEKCSFVSVAGHVGSYAGEAMNISHMTTNELSQAIPPAYTHHIGLCLKDL